MTGEGWTLGRRLASCLDAPRLELEVLCTLAGIEASRDVASAAVGTGPRPRMLLNPDFVQEHCRLDEHLVLLVLHELWHVLLAHNVLYPRVTEVQNIAFDAVVNAGLCRWFRAPDYFEFFQRFNGPQDFPGLLLRPPEGWPSAPRYPDVHGPEVAGLLRRLYPGAENLEDPLPMFREVLEVLERRLPAGAEGLWTPPASRAPTPGKPNLPRPEGAPPRRARRPGRRARRGPSSRWGRRRGSRRRRPARSPAPRTSWTPAVLLGDHRRPDLEKAALRDPVFRAVLDRVARAWPVPPMPLREPGDPRQCQTWLFLPQRPWRRTRAAFARALRRALGPVPGRARRARPDQEEREVGLGVLPSARDRLHPARLALGLSPLLWQQWTPRPVRSPGNPGAAHVYVDVSGSVWDALPVLAGLLLPYVASGRARLYQFSNEVHPLPLPEIRQGLIRSTQGTDIACVCRHLLEAPGVRKALLLTDGFTREPEADHLRHLQDRGVQVHVVLGGTQVNDSDLDAMATTMVHLPGWP